MWQRMIVCSCNRITDREVRDAARNGARTPEQAYATLGCEPQCGCCLDYAQQLNDAEQPKRPKLRAVA
jgi:bacterioferritin-associated ferredoxin